MIKSLSIAPENTWKVYCYQFLFISSGDFFNKINIPNVLIVASVHMLVVFN